MDTDTNGTLRLWHKVKHHEVGVSQVAVVGGSVMGTIEGMIRDGGFWESKTVFVPWGNVTWIQFQPAAEEESST
jgi:hypothetical protein